MSRAAGIRPGLRRPGILRRRFYVMAILLLAETIAGCGTTGHGRAGVPPPASAATAPYFLLKGRISVRTGDRIESGGIRWERGPAEERLEFFTPFGGQVAELVKRADGGVLLRRSQETVTAASMEALTASVLGVALDLDAIAAWIQGAGAIDGEMREQRLAGGDAWQVTAEQFQQVDAYRFAARLSALRGDTVVRLVVDEWQPR